MAQNGENANDRENQLRGLFNQFLELANTPTKNDKCKMCDQNKMLVDDLSKANENMAAKVTAMQQEIIELRAKVKTANEFEERADKKRAELEEKISFALMILESHQAPKDEYRAKPPTRENNHLSGPAQFNYWQDLRDRCKQLENDEKRLLLAQRVVVQPNENQQENVPIQGGYSGGRGGLSRNGVPSRGRGAGQTSDASISSTSHIRSRGGRGGGLWLGGNGLGGFQGGGQHVDGHEQSSSYQQGQ